MDGMVKFWQIQTKSKDGRTVATFEKAVQGVAVHPNM